MTHILVTYKAPAEHKALYLDGLGGRASFAFLNELAVGEREPALREAEVLLSWNVPREIGVQSYGLLHRVSFLQLMSAGADHVPFGELPSHIIIASNHGAYAIPMAEHVLAMTLALAKRLIVQNENLRRGEFDQFVPNRLLNGLEAGILGFGGIGRATARLMRPFGMRILAINSTGQTAEPTDFIGTLRDLEHVLRVSDVVVVSLPLTKATKGLIGKNELDWMKPDAIIVNVSRGAILEEKALYAHVRNHPGFQLGIDAWWTEPFRQGKFLMEDPFLELPNVIGSPHNSAMVPGSLLDGARQAMGNIKRFLEGGTVDGIIRREDYF